MDGWTDGWMDGWTLTDTTTSTMIQRSMMKIRSSVFEWIHLYVYNDKRYDTKVIKYAAQLRLL